MKKLIALGLAGLLGCTSPGSRGPVASDSSYVVKPEPGFPSWVEVPAWMEQESRQERSESDGSGPTVNVVFSVCTWSAQEPGMPVFSHDGYAILGDAETDRIMAKLMGNFSGRITTAPTLVAGLGQSSSAAITAPAERTGHQRGGLVVFMSPTTIDEEGVNLRFSFQCGRYPLESKSDSARVRFGTNRLEGHVRLDVGQRYVRAVKGDYPLDAGTDMAVFIEIARVDYPEVTVGELVAVLGAAHPPVE